MDIPTQIPKACFLGLPRELRLQIYEIVSQFDVDYKSEHTRHPRHSNFVRPNMGLPLQSRAVAYELRALTCSLPSSERFAIATIEVSPLSYDVFHVRRAPCPVADVKVLKIEVTHTWKAQTSHLYIMFPENTDPLIDPGVIGVFIRMELKYLLCHDRFFFWQGYSVGKSRSPRPLSPTRAVC